ncbi:MAG: hypothetical protein ABIK09_05210 [Pseudomonadota bacterium]
MNFKDTIAPSAGANKRIDTRYLVGPEALHVGDGAHVRHLILQAWDATARGHLTSRATLGRDANLVTALTSFGGNA